MSIDAAQLRGLLFSPPLPFPSFLLLFPAGQVPCGGGGPVVDNRTYWQLDNQLQKFHTRHGNRQGNRPIERKRERERERESRAR
jgi:hypothetical protein